MPPPRSRRRPRQRWRSSPAGTTAMSCASPTRSRWSGVAWSSTAGTPRPPRSRPSVPTASGPMAWRCASCATTPATSQDSCWTPAACSACGSSAYRSEVSRGMAPLPRIRIEVPAWASELVDWDRAYTSDEERMDLAIALARENVLREGGGPFGAAVFEADSGRPVGVGVNLVMVLNNSVLHAETVALMLAQQRLGSYPLRAPGMPAHELVASCDPCAMCLGATLWSGVTRLVCGAAREDAVAIGFDEGPVFPASYEYLEERGIAITRGVRRAEARAVLELYRDRGGIVYNA